MPFVVDTSITMAWCFEDESSPAADRALDRLRRDAAVVPGLWRLEVTNVLLVAEGRGRIAEAQAARFLALLEQLPIDVDESPGDFQAVLAAGRRHGLSAYDAAYLTLAERLGAPLATLDSRLATAAGAAGIELLGAESAERDGEQSRDRNPPAGRTPGVI